MDILFALPFRLPLLQNLSNSGDLVLVTSTNWVCLIYSRTYPYISGDPWGPLFVNSLMTCLDGFANLRPWSFCV